MQPQPQPQATPQLEVYKLVVGRMWQLGALCKLLGIMLLTTIPIRIQATTGILLYVTRGALLTTLLRLARTSATMGYLLLKVIAKLS